MSNTMNHIVAFVYYNGRKFEGNEGLTFEGQKRTMHLKRKMSMDNLKQRIHSKLKLECNKVISGVTCRILMSQNPKYFSGAQVSDDEDVACMINAFSQQASMNILELYVDIDEVGSSSAPIHTYPMLTPQTLTNEGVRQMGETGDGSTHDNVDTNVNLGDDGDDYHNDYEVHPDAYYSEDEDERAEGQIPNGESSDTDIEGDFDSNDQPPIAHASPISPMTHASPIPPMAPAHPIQPMAPIPPIPSMALVPPIPSMAPAPPIPQGVFKILISLHVFFC